MNTEQLRNILAQATEKAGSIRLWSANHGFSAAYVCDVLIDRRDISDRIAGALGYRREFRQSVVYRRETARRRSAHP